jgi:hypothetical protein
VRDFIAERAENILPLEQVTVPKSLAGQKFLLAVF